MFKAYHRYTPTLSVCDVARKSFVGENATLVAILGVRKASMSRPVGMSKVRMIESSDVVTSHRESGEKVCRDTLDKPCVRASYRRQYLPDPMYGPDDHEALLLHFSSRYRLSGPLDRRTRPRANHCPAARSSIGRNPEAPKSFLALLYGSRRTGGTL